MIIHFSYRVSPHSGDTCYRTIATLGKYWISHDRFTYTECNKRKIKQEFAAHTVSKTMNCHKLSISYNNFANKYCSPFLNIDAAKP